MISGFNRFVWAALLSLVFVASAQAAKNFPTGQFSYYLGDYDTALARIARTVTKPVAELKAELTAAEAVGNDRLAAVAVEQILSLSPKDAGLWLRLARHLAVAQPINDSDNWELPSKTVGASLKAYLLARKAPEEAEALALAAQGFGKREQWRPALVAYKESLRLVENEANRQAYETMRIDHGFRVTDYKVENDANPPRACFTLSEALSRSVTDFTPYFAQEPGPVAAVSAEGSRLCVEGLKHGGRYKITVRQGLPSAVDEDMPKDFDYDFYVRDRGAGVRFATKSYVLPRSGQNGIPLISVNSDAARLALYRIGDRNLIDNVMGSDFRSQINGFTAEEIGNREGSKVWEGVMETPAPLNEDVTTAFPVDEALGKLEAGLYVMTARPAAKGAGESWDSVATQWFVVSDLGLSTMDGSDGLQVLVRSIASAETLKDVDVRLIARNNEILATAKTDANGAVTFAPGLSKGLGGLEATLVVAQTAEDYGFIDLSQSAFDLTDRGVSGRPPPGAVDAFVYAERGVYRRGETVHATVLLRDAKANAMAGAPLSLVVVRPDGVEYSRTSLDDQGAGGRSHDFRINAAAQGGTWWIKAYTDPKADPVGITSFLVEDYIPDRIEFDLKAKSEIATVGEGAKFTVDGRYLFGAPGAGLDLEANITVSVNPEPFAAWKGYSFGLSDETVSPVQNYAQGLAQTDINGHAEVLLRLPDLPVTTRPLKADVAVRMREPGGRAVENTATLPVQAQQPMLGLKADSQSVEAPEGQPLDFSAIAVDQGGKAVAAQAVAWTLKRVTTDYQWYNTDGYWNYEGVTRAARIANGTVEIGADKPLKLNQTVDWGRYRLELAANGFASTSIDFDAGYYGGSGAAVDTPDTLNVALDTTFAKTGDTVNVRIASRFAGKATVQIMGDRLLSSFSINVPEGGANLPVKVGEGWGTGAYVLATLFRPMDVAAKRMPARAVGVAWFSIDRGAKELDVKLSPVDLMKPRQNLKVPVKIGGLSAGEEAYLTVAAVDVGILNLTRYQPPAPENYYYDQKRLSAELRDLYGALIDGMQGQRGKIRSGGDGGAAFNAPPPTQPPLSLFSGIVKVGADGMAEVSFYIPGFNGTVRVMAVVWSAGKVGHGVADVIVRDAMVLSGTLPRFMAVGDASRLRLDIINTEAPAGDYSLGVAIDGPVSGATATQTITIGSAGARVPVLIPIDATGPGVAHLTARLVGPGNVVIEQNYTLNIVPANPLVTRRTTMELAANKGAITLTQDLLADMLPGTGAVSLSVSPLPELDAAGLIRDLDRYPYGCSEQTVSRALPLLYLSDLGTVLDGDVTVRLQEQVERLINRQGGNGAFGMWSANDGDSSLWISSFVTDFLLRAREKGFAVPEDNLLLAIDYLRNTIGNAPSIEDGAGQDTAYALYVLARAGRAPVGDLKYLADTRLEAFGSPLARAQIGAALALLGDTGRSARAFASAVAALAEAELVETTAYRADYGSVLRDASAILALATDAKSEPGIIKAALTSVATARAKRSYASTQEMSWMVLAARAIQAEAKALKLNVNGKDETGTLYKLFGEGELDSDFRVMNKGSQPLRAVVAVSGSPLVAEPASSNGLTIARSYHLPDGTEVDPASVKQNTRLVVVLNVSATDGRQDGTFILSDPLPAGFEIENPTLVTSGSTASLSWIAESGWASHTEFRDDRFVAAFKVAALRLAYMIRVVAPGTYAHPGASVEDMYRPEVNARMATGTVVVTEP